MSKINNGPPAVESADQLSELPLTDEARALLEPDGKPMEYLNRLVDSELDVDAVRVLAHTLPIRQAVWWGCLCVWHALAGKPSPAEDQALASVVGWVRQPSAPARAAALAAAERIAPENPAGCCARAASLAGNAAESDGPLLADQPLVAAKATEGAVFLACVRGLSYQDAIDIGLELADGKADWTEKSGT